ncbi:DUF72 domain-containing protein [Pseudomonas sp. NC26]|uniref:DUF72 domain-containing protein n=1 Tax=Pseudomonas putida TaxID=303 RepID=A0A7W2QHV7_PSEPU|nr:MULTISPECIES: DUF72 domain-containing protein [Pseudomonas]MBA6115210.1 DUF72 domain-containing protein [Pseudomonas putida]MCZ9639392.1 DUF72 domain-containing protein [Pseudomonas putida]MEC4874662.1 DUF72 domain-containing protein [Pseudomonas sp. NC26]QNL88544.1 Uncharacterized protein PPKH_3130 [Pseudomonas putida]
MIHLGCAGWSLSSHEVHAFPGSGSHLQRYAAQLNAVEINSSFYRPHRPQTYARWAASVPEGFRFSVKLPKAITHELRLQGCEALLDTFLGQCGQLQGHLGCLLVQLPPSLAFDREGAQRFFASVRQRYTGALAVEPRHASWQAAQPMLVQMQVAQVAASPPRLVIDAQPGGWPGLVYWRLHGVPRTYASAYSAAFVQQMAVLLTASAEQGVPTWCIFDNTASGAALGNALATLACLNAAG